MAAAISLGLSSKSGGFQSSNLLAVPADGVHTVLLQVEEHLRNDARRLGILFEEPVAALFE